ncbi:hypothetical protein MAPG_12027 [Magnaporthiopsis poae ATCC 64411]|uniref:C2H2-type domain-containing protein n=1 Tax=Magnaporthiopsis poae (strain ATCC 64411 / 73-15) TaxID=644358 RepID=A0A0C4EGP5_MAGP6|nr:hypothetical protein MAPG_12027 [Magnaporthiopsis poae ATCC 64411]
MNSITLAVCGGGPGFNGEQQQQQQCDDSGEAAAIDRIWESWHLEGAELDELVELLADRMHASRHQDGDHMIGVLVDDVDEQQPRHQDNDNKEDDINDWTPTFPLSAYMADKLKPAAATTITPPTPSGSGTAAPELTRASSSSAATASSMRSPGTPRAGGEGAPPLLHPRPFRCAKPGCKSAFKQKRDLMRHVGSRHDKSKIPCPRCHRNIKGARKDNLRRHLRIKHGVS